MPIRLFIIALVSLATGCLFSGSGPENSANNANNANNGGNNSSACGNGRIDPDELCDPCDKLVCPSDGCGIWAQTGSAATCDLACVRNGEQTACGNGDGCCPAGCTPAVDDDCSADCGNEVLDEDEVCDPCPQACPDNPCEPVEQSGDKSTCDLTCTPLPQPLGCCGGELCPDTMVCTPGDQCIMPGCMSAADCERPSEVCVDGVCVEPPGCDGIDDCALWEQCNANGRCVPAEDCTRARDREAWCAFNEFEPGQQTAECDPFSSNPPVCEVYMPIECATNADCRAWERCETEAGVPCGNTGDLCTCIIPTACSLATDPDTYCIVQFGDPDKVCDEEECI